MLAWIKKHLTVLNVEKVDPIPNLSNLFNESEIEFYTLAVYNRIITKNNLNLGYHYKIGHLLEQALYEGWGYDLMQVPFTSSEYEVLQGLRRHIYVFSAAKQYSQVREMSQFINIAGQQSTFGEFKKLADKVFSTYNKTYLKTEYNTAIKQSESAKQWTLFEDEKESLPMLRFHTQGDARVRDEHAILNGITKPVVDPFWNTMIPPLAWNCRCFVTQHGKYTKETGETPEIPWGEKEYPNVFKMNPGKDKLIFNPKFHPYFQVARGDAEFRANNYNMPRL